MNLTIPEFYINFKQASLISLYLQILINYQFKVNLKIKSINSIKYVGIIVDNQLRWEHYITNFLKKMRYVVYKIKNCLIYLRRPTLKDVVPYTLWASPNLWYYCLGKWSEYIPEKKKNEILIQIIYKNKQIYFILKHFWR